MIAQDLFGNTNAEIAVQSALATKPARHRRPARGKAEDQTTKAAPQTADLFAPPIAPASAPALPGLEDIRRIADAPAEFEYGARQEARPLSKWAQSRFAKDIVVCPTPPATFAEAIALIAASGTIDEERLKSFRRDINWVQRRLPAPRDGTPAAPLPCDPQRLRPILQNIQPGRHKISPKRWSNIRNELAAIQRKTGWLPPRSGRAVLQSPGWNAGLALITETPPQAMFRAFAAYCEAAGLAPGDVSPSQLPLYQAHLERTKATIRPAKTSGALRYTWNKLCREHPDWGGRAFPPKVSPRYIRSAADQIPAAFFQDLDAYIAKLRKPGLFDRRFPMKTAEATISTRIDIYKLAASVLVKSGWKPETLTSLRALTTPEAVAAILTDYHRRNCPSGDWTYGAETTAIALKTLASQWGDLSAEGLAEVTKICKTVRCKKSAFPRKAQERLRQFDDKDVERRFWDLPRKLWQDIVPKHERQNRPHRAAYVAKVALSLAILIDKPLRITNFTNLDLAYDFVRDKKDTIIGIKIEGERTTKGGDDPDPGLVFWRSDKHEKPSDLFGIRGFTVGGCGGTQPP